MIVLKVILWAQAVTTLAAVAWTCLVMFARWSEARGAAIKANGGTR